MSRAFSLLEALVVAALVSVVLGSVAGLVREYGRLGRFTASRSERVESLMQLERVRSELKQAVEVQVPAVGSLSSQNRLVIRRFIPSSSTARLPVPAALPGTPWDPEEPSWLATVEFEVAAVGLIRRVTLPGPQVTTVTLNESFSGFTCRELGPQEYQLSASSNEDGVVVSHQLTVRQERGGR